MATQLSTRTTLQKRLSTFVDWIGPKPETRKEVKGQADTIRKAITAEAVKDGLIIMETPYAGSFQKKTGLRRYKRGNSEVEGQDIDIPFIVKNKDINGKEVTELISRFNRYAKAAFPTKVEKPTKSSVVLKYTEAFWYDLVPLLATDEKDKQILIRSDGERRETSVLKHTEFIKKRTEKSKELPGRVCFNECVRLIKWWRYFRQEESSIFDNDKNSIPSFLFDLLCANAFDRLSVKETYAETIASWFGYLSYIVQNKQAVIFTENYSAVDGVTAQWSVYDPVNPKNNITKKWTNLQISELASWLSQSHDDFVRAIAKDLEGNDSLSMDELVKIFGNPLKNNVE